MNGIFKAPGPDGWDVYDITVDGEKPTFNRTNREPEGFFVPGFVDLHIHGAFGIDFMSATKADLVELAELLKKEGYAGFLPTTITADYESTQSAVNNLPVHPLIWGFHLEGPFISPQYPGAQPMEAISTIPREQSQWENLFYDKRLKLVTLAPELPHALELTKRLVALGVIVSGGHSNATYDEFVAAIHSGLTHATHTYNAMRGLHHREPGTLGAVLSNDAVFAELIYDRQHVSKPAAEILIKSKPSNKVIAVSDCTLAKGQQTGDHFKMWGHEVIKGNDDVRLANNQALAGSSSTLLDCFRNLCQDFGPETAIRLCCTNPLIELKISNPTRWIVFDNDLNLQTF